MEFQTANAKGDQTSSESLRNSCSKKNKLRVLVLDLWCYVPYYDRYFCEGLLSVNVEPRLAAASYYLDPGYFQKHGIRNRPGVIDLAARIHLSNQHLRRSLMLVEFCLNLIALSVWLVFAKPNIIHIQWIPLVRRVPFDIWFIKFAKSRGIKIVYTVHNVLPHDTGDRFKDVYRNVYSQVDALVCHNRQTKARLESEFAVNPSRIWVIPHGPLFHDAEPRAESFTARPDVPRNKCLVLMQGMLKPYKGVGFLLEAWHRLACQGVHAQLLIVGIADSHFEEEIRTKVDRLKIQDSVILDIRYIYDDELYYYYNLCDILVYPYQSITASGALMTGLSFRKPTIVTRLPAFEEIFEDGKGASFVDFGDVEALALSLKQLIENPDQRKRLAEEGAQILRQKYSWVSIGNQTKNCYLQVLENDRPAQQQART